MLNREIDALIAEKVMGYEPSEFTHWPCGKARSPNQLYWRKDGKLFMFDNLPHYSTDIAAAWQVVDKLRKIYCFQLDSVGFKGAEWRCMIGWGDDPINAIGEHCEPQMAICLATLEAAGMDPKIAEKVIIEEQLQQKVNQSWEMDVLSRQDRDKIAAAEKQKNKVTFKAVKNCTREISHEGPCNGWPCEFVQNQMKNADLAMQDTPDYSEGRPRCKGNCGDEECKKWESFYQKRVTKRNKTNGI